MNAGDLASIILTLLSSAVIIVGGIRWYIENRIKPVHDKIEEIWVAIEDVLKETKTNGGTSMRDEIKFIKLEQERSAKTRLAYNDKLDHMYEILIEYISKNSK
jgi:uncharacterized protein (UPF0335 family)